ncbi:MAG: hypothetical protein RLP09_45530 [Sandaracinaceae bacterium]|nr:hypothetical protein [Myxococcales bacterium]
MEGLAEGRFDGAPPDLVHAGSGFRIWFVQPLGLITQVGHQARVGEDVARFLSGEGQAELDRRRVGSERFTYLHDWRRLDGYSPASRKIMTDWGLRVGRDTERIVIALRTQAKVVRMGVSVATMAMGLAGFQIEMVESLDETIAALELRHAPRRDSLRPG